MTYAIYRVNESPEQAETGLTPQQVVAIIYSHDGHGFRVEPRMETPQDDDGNDLEARQVDGTLGKEWDVYFTRAGGQHGEKSTFTAYGESEDAAESDFLLDAWNNNRWDDSQWFIITDEQHAAEMAQIDDNAVD